MPVDPWDDLSVHKAELAEAIEVLARRGIEAATYVPAGEPGGAIEKVADDGGYDVIVVGSRGLGLLSRILQGSVSEYVAAHARETVIVAR
jgi:nucleotide-binding universal stress UspA family protein